MFENTTKIREFAQIQENLNSLPEKASESDIANFINQIPQEYLQQKDDLMIICQLIGRYSRNFVLTSKRNTIKLFEYLMDQIKTLLRDESEFFWNILGGTYYMHLWMHQQGLISIEEIILRIQKFKCPPFTEYFLPEIIEEAPDIFENEIKNSLNLEYSKESIEKFKELRKKHFKWLIESSDYNDPFYREIETDPLRLALKTDDIESFQRIVSNLNLSVNYKIQESLLENFFIDMADYSLLEFAILFNSTKIFKYLVMNGSDGEDYVYMSIWRRNYEMIHIIESLKKEDFIDKALYFSITLCNNEIVEYILDNYGCDVLEKSELTSDEKNDILTIFGNTARSTNFIVLESVLLPFIQKNPEFVDENIFEILNKSSQDYSGFFIRELMKSSKFDVNTNAKSRTEPSLLEYALSKRNKKMIEILLSDPNIDLISRGFNGFQPYMLACGLYSSMTIMDMICRHQNAVIDLNELFASSAILGSFYCLQYIIDNFKEKKISLSVRDMFMAAAENKWYTVELLLSYYVDHHKEKSSVDIIDEFQHEVPQDLKDKDELISRFIRLVPKIKLCLNQ